MKLKNFIRHIDWTLKVEIFTFNAVTYDEERLYSGPILDVPWYLAEARLDTNADGEAMSLGRDDENKPYLIIYVLDEENL